MKKFFLYLIIIFSPSSAFANTSLQYDKNMLLKIFKKNHDDIVSDTSKRCNYDSISTSRIVGIITSNFLKDKRAFIVNGALCNGGNANIQYIVLTTGKSGFVVELKNSVIANSIKLSDKFIHIYGHTWGPVDPNHFPSIKCYIKYNIYSKKEEVFYNKNSK